MLIIMLFSPVIKSEAPKLLWLRDTKKPVVAHLLKQLVRREHAFLLPLIHLYRTIQLQCEGV